MLERTKVAGEFAFLGDQSFGEMVRANVLGTSSLAKKHPEIFKTLVTAMMGWAPDAFEVVPPAAAAGRESASSSRMIIEGPCQSGKTRVTIALAWLYYHYCGCYSFIGAWRFTSSREGELAF